MRWDFLLTTYFNFIIGARIYLDKLQAYPIAVTTMEAGKLLESILPKERIKSREIDLAAYASDAGFYYLKPKAVVQPVSEEEIKALFRFSRQHKIPLTFRTAGTSLSGQAITDGILVDLSRHWRGLKVEHEGEQLRVQPGVIGAIANGHLKKYNKKIGPDPASINSAMIGGILSNNASGMCCGVAKNSYHTTKYLHFILPDGKSYNTEVKEDYERFIVECPELSTRLLALKEVVMSNQVLYQKVRNKYKTKNTVGYSVNAFVDYDKPLDILAHLLIGAEGTLGFIAGAVLDTVPDYAVKSTALLYFPDIYAACKAIGPLTISGAEAIELMDRASLRSVEHIAGLPEIIKTLPASAAALLVEYQANTTDDLDAKITQFDLCREQLLLLAPPRFTTDPVEQVLLWKVRKGMFPSVGAVRASGTTVILEDIAFPVHRLSDAILDLQHLFAKYNYDNAIIFGHAREGNIHFVITQAFETKAEIERYDRFLREVVHLVVNKYDGALKAEHGTGRNMAPFVETEWGPEIYEIMRSLKESIDPENLLNPGVIINADSNAHIQNLKDLPGVEEEVDKCMECGFCEHRCPSRDITMTPRQRIVVRRELKKRKINGDSAGYKQLLREYQYDGMDTCAVDGLCAEACPVDINTGLLIKRLRKENHGEWPNRFALQIAKNFRLVFWGVKTALHTGAAVNKVFGKNSMLRLTGGLKKIVPAMPLWSNQLRPAPALRKLNYANHGQDQGRTIVYYPSCISRAMGGSAAGKKSVVEVFMSVASKAGVKLVMPAGINATCCGQPFSSKGFNRAYAYMVNETISKLWNCSKEGAYPVVMDITACTHTLQTCRGVLTTENRQRFDALKIIDSIEFIGDYILPHVSVANKKASISLHPVCSLYKMGLEGKFLHVARQFASEVKWPLHAGCCGMAGDRGFLFPELTAAATRPEATEVNEREYDGYYSTSKTCEIALSDAVGKNYESILHLVDECI